MGSAAKSSKSHIFKEVDILGYKSLSKPEYYPLQLWEQLVKAFLEVDLPGIRPASGWLSSSPSL